MTPQTKVVLIGLATGLVAKFWLGKPNFESLTFGLAGISVYSILTAHSDKKEK